ncbi:unnamed protein product [Protopolystoma xenopodis]|uniref:Uncharacterized protein n=1 Tax=Protopolystoma xenopodis TaxID=117903 RepID=A0A3S5ALD9_9PLAT|nr:unnamed protein product [Protopolystoma xenopodis]
MPEYLTVPLDIVYFLDTYFQPNEYALEEKNKSALKIVELGLSSSRNTIDVERAKSQHWGGLRARLELSIDSVLEQADKLAALSVGASHPPRLDLPRLDRPPRSPASFLSTCSFSSLASANSRPNEFFGVDESKLMSSGIAPSFSTQIPSNHCNTSGGLFVAMCVQKDELTSLQSSVTPISARMPLAQNLSNKTEDFALHISHKRENLGAGAHLGNESECFFSQEKGLASDSDSLTAQSDEDSSPDAEEVRLLYLVITSIYLCFHK